MVGLDICQQAFLSNFVSLMAEPKFAAFNS